MLQSEMTKFRIDAKCREEVLLARVIRDSIGVNSDVQLCDNLTDVLRSDRLRGSSRALTWSLMIGIGSEIG